jgi:hypothetical protein
VKLYHVYVTEPIGYDEWEAFVVRAENEDQARELAWGEGRPYAPASEADRHNNVWFSDVAHVEEIPTEGAAEVILGSFNAG